MVKKIRDKNGISRAVNQIPKYPPRYPTDFPKPVAEDKFHENMICLDSGMPFAKPKGVVDGLVTARNVPKRFARAAIAERAQGFSDPANASLIRIS